MSDIKQVKVDNWGIFFLQRLQQFFNRTDFCDLTLQFENNVQLKVHRLVINACTEYFQLLENQCEVIDNCLVMPMDLQPDVVVPIINFMYTGQLEFLMSNYDKLYAAAKLMKMTVLTKLLDAQKVPVKPIQMPRNKRYTIGPVTWNLQGKKITPKAVDPDLPEMLPGRKLPIWKRRKIPGTLSRNDNLSKHIPEVTIPYKTPIKNVDNTPRPTRFEWPEGDLPTVSYFDDISYHSEPLTANSVPKPAESNSSAVFEEIKRTASAVKRPVTTEIPSDKTINLKDVKEFLEEQRVRNDYILKNDLSHNEDIEDMEVGGSEIILGVDDPKNKIVKVVDEAPQTKKVKFNIEGKENTKTVEAKVTSSDNINDHTSLIAEVLKKYPHLMQKNKNIKLKIIKRNCENIEKGKKINYTIKEELNKGEVCIIVDHEEEEEEPKPETDSATTDFFCRECSTSNQYLGFKTYSKFLEHLTETHPSWPASRICPTCAFQAANETNLVHHVYVKHQIKLPNFKRKRFLPCKKCNYVALNSAKLKIHLNEHMHSTTCQDCANNLPNYIEFIKHSHTMKHNQGQHFYCPFCVKKFIRTSSLYTHMRTHHPYEHLEEEFEVSASAKTLETINDGQDSVAQESVNIDMTSTPSSEAEALNNVATGIAASLGLVDTIVVLDDQYVLRGDQTNPENQQIVISTDVNGDAGNNPNGSQPGAIISQSEIVANSSTMTSTDELVMVLTDHNYGDEGNTIINPENSNIVVLYSHPIENQSEFISQPSDIILNHSTSDILELAEPKPEVVQIDDSQESAEDTKSQPETIELIQEEINKHLTVDKMEDPEDRSSEKDLEPMEVDEQIEEDKSLAVEAVPVTNNTETLPEDEIKQESEIVPKDEISEENQLEETKVEENEPTNHENEPSNEVEVDQVEAMEVDGVKSSENQEENDEKPTDKNLEVISSSSSDECILLPDETLVDHSDENKDAVNQIPESKELNGPAEISTVGPEDKNNVTDLVSDWCDDDSGQQNSSEKKSSESLGEETTTTTTTTTEVKESPSETTKDEKSCENVKINKLLDDWDDVDTDSQKSNEPSQSSIKIPITNLIDDWADDE